MSCMRLGTLELDTAFQPRTNVSEARRRGAKVPQKRSSKKKFSNNSG
jgi:hypothetical protein